MNACLIHRQNYIFKNFTNNLFTKIDSINKNLKFAFILKDIVNKTKFNFSENLKSQNLINDKKSGIYLSSQCLSMFSEIKLYLKFFNIAIQNFKNYIFPICYVNSLNEIIFSITTHKRKKIKMKKQKFWKRRRAVRNSTKIDK